VAWWKSTKKTSALWIALVRILLIRRLKVKCESTNIPRSETLVSWDLLLRYVWGIIDLDLWWMDKTLHLLILMFNCQDLAHDEKRSRLLDVTTIKKTSTLKDEYSLILSAKSFSLAWPIQVKETLFINNKNKTGPRTEPCGTPLSTLVTLEK